MADYGAPADFSRPGTITQWLQLYLDIPSDQIVGCSEAEVAEVERVAGRPLPAAYTQMLREMGRQVGTDDNTFRRSWMLYPHVLEVRDIAADVIRGENADASVLEWAFPFFNWEGYNIRLLDLSEQVPDPPILGLSEVTGCTYRQYEKFSQFLALRIMSAIGVRKLRVQMDQEKLVRETEQRAKKMAEEEDLRQRAKGAEDVWWRPSS